MRSARVLALGGLSLASSVALVACSALTGFGDLEFDDARDLGGIRDAGRGDGGRGDGAPTFDGDVDADGGPRDSGRPMRDGDAPSDVGPTPPIDGATPDADVDPEDMAMPPDDGGPPDRDTAITDGDGGAACSTRVQCADRNDCTVDDCVGGRCVNVPSSGLPCDDHDVCTTGDVCADGTCVPGGVTMCVATPCFSTICDPVAGCATPSPAGTTCFDVGPCALAAQCDGSGSCIALGTCPEDGNPCTSQMCGASGCESVPVANETTCGTSGICCGGACINAGSDDSNCGACANLCAAGTTCRGGTCAACAISADCADAYACTNDTCFSGECTHTLLSNQCLIDGNCYEGGDRNPANRCQRCLPSASTTTWSDVTNGAACEDGLGCTRDDTCFAGVCFGGPDPCEGGTVNCRPTHCVEPSGFCMPEPGGDPCPGTTVCCADGTCNLPPLCPLI